MLRDAHCDNGGEASMPQLTARCELWSRCRNIFSPRVSLVERACEQSKRRPRIKHDDPATPAGRLIRSETLGDAEETGLREVVARTNSLRLYADIERRLARVNRKTPGATKRDGADGSSIPSESAPPLLQKQRLMVSGT